MSKVLITSRSFGNVYRDSVKMLEEGGCEIVRSPYARALKEKELLELIGGIDAVIVGVDEVTAKNVLRILNGEPPVSALNFPLP